MTRTLGSSRLGRLAQRERGRRVAALEQCELCSEPIPAEHRHVLDLTSREVMCACRPCSLLFDGGHGLYRLIPDRRLHVTDLELGDAAWEELRLPVEMAFFFHNTAAGRVMAFYPSPMGPTESMLGLDAWEGLVAANPVLGTLQPDVEALLVNRARGAQQHFVVPIAECYALVGLIRTHWKGLTGGKEVWEQITRFFEALDRRSRPASREDTR